MTNDPSDLLGIFENPAILNMFASIAGMRQRLMDDGWTKEQAQDIVAAMFRSMGKEDEVAS